MVPPGEFSSFRSHHQHFPFMGSPDRPTPPFFAFSLSFLQYTGRAFAFGLGGSWWAGGVGGLLEFIGRTNNSIRAPPPLFFYFRPPFSLGIFFFSPPLFRRHFLPLHLAAPNEEPKRRNGRKWASEEFQSHSTFLRHLVPFFGCLFAKDASPPPLPAHSGKKRASLLIPRLWAEMGSPRNEKGPSRSEGKESRRRERDRSH